LRRRWGTVAGRPPVGLAAAAAAEATAAAGGLGGGRWLAPQASQRSCPRHEPSPRLPHSVRSAALLSALGCHGCRSCLPTRHTPLFLSPGSLGAMSPPAARSSPPRPFPLCASPARVLRRDRSEMIDEHCTRRSVVILLAVPGWLTRSAATLTPSAEGGRLTHTLERALCMCCCRRPFILLARPHPASHGFRFVDQLLA
jgi:hypothetical protein